MDNQIICPHCKKQIAITEALSHQMQEKMQSQLEEEKRKIYISSKKWLEDEQKRKEKEFEHRSQEMENALKIKLQNEVELKLKDTQNESEELKKQKQVLQEQILDTNKLIRQLRTELDQKNLEVEKKLAEEQDKIREEAKKQSDEANRLNMAALEKKLNDALKVNDELKRKLEQGSQQAQGEVLELQVEELLKREFPLDEIKEVPKGKLGADLIQIVRSRSGEHCGTIIWELKRTKVWSNEWIPKLKNDQREVKAEIAVIISEVLPPDQKVFGLKEGVWVGSFASIVGLAAALRKSLLDVSMVKLASVGKKEKMEIMWEYLTSIEFKQKVEAIIEVFASMQTDIEKEKAWFKKKWEKQESSIRRVIDNTAGMYGSLESIMGKSLPEVKGFDLVDDDIEQPTMHQERSQSLTDENSALF